MTEFLEWLADAADRRAARGLTRRLHTTKPGDLLDLAGNDYLGLRTDPRVIAAAVAAVESHGGGSGASRLVTGTLPVHDDLEATLAGLLGSPAALVLSTGYAANLAALTTLTDADTLVVSDAHAHASLIDGCRLSRAGRVAVSRHNDLDHIAELLSGRAEGRAVVVAESIYSVLGDAAPVAELVDLTRAQGAVLVIDEAHAVGVCGVGGRGLVAEVTGFGAGAPGLEHVVVTGTLSKSLAAQGGFVMSHPSVREHLVNTARPFIYDTGLAPAAAGAALGALDALASEPDRPKRLHDNAARLAAALGIDTPAGGVMSVPMPGPEEALAAVARAAEQGVRIGCFRPPSTPDGSSRLRLTANAGLSDTDLDRASAILEDLA